jgi:hypothetical protein
LGKNVGQHDAHFHFLDQLRDPKSFPVSTPLYSQLETLDFATRLAKVIASRLKKPTYVGSSLSFASAGRGGDPEEEMEGFRKIVEVVTQQVKA